MIRILSLAILAALLSATALCQSLGEVARQNRQTPHKKAVRAFDNDSLPKRQILTDADAPDGKTVGENGAIDSVAKDSREGADSADDDGAKDADDKAVARNKEGSGQENGEAAKAKVDGANAEIEAQKRVIDLLQREVDVTTKEAQLQNTLYYQDAGSRLRNPQAWAEQAKKNQDTIAEKTKALQDAKDQLEQMQESARKRTPSPPEE